MNKRGQGLGPDWCRTEADGLVNKRPKSQHWNKVSCG